MTQRKTLDFASFLDFFPDLELPVVLTDEGVVTFSKTNKPLTDLAISQILEWEKEYDDLTEFIPCFKLADTKDFYAFIYYKAATLKYEYVLITTDLKGKIICRRSLSSTIVEGSIVKKSIAKIDEDWIIHIIAGAHQSKELKYDPNNSRAFSMEIQASGEVIFSLSD